MGTPGQFSEINVNFDLFLQGNLHFLLAPSRELRNIQRNSRILTSSNGCSLLRALTLNPVNMFSQDIRSVFGTTLLAASLATAPALALGNTITGSSVRSQIGKIEAKAEAQVDGKMLHSLEGASRIAVIVELADEPAAVTFAREAAVSETAAYGAAASQVSKLKAAQAQFIPQLTGKDFKAVQLYTLQRSLNGVAVLVDESKIEKLSQLPGVKAVHRVPIFERTAGNSADFLRVPEVWTAVSKNLRGEGIRVGVIDSGIDYIHANFGGPGTLEAYIESGYGSTAPNQYYPNAKVVGGYDFCGDAYHAGGTPEQQIPQPDMDPLDCNGHGTGCASIIGGYGMNADGSTFAGPYDGTVPYDDLSIGPGLAPLCQLYALRVFGCSGSTSLVAEAVEWAMDPNGDGNMNDRLDVINMSLGSVNGVQYGSGYAELSANAALIGMVVVASAGNESDTYYNTGSPAVSTPIISTAAAYNDDFTYPTVVPEVTLTPSSGDPIPAGTQFFCTTSSFAPVPTVEGLTGKIVVADPILGNSGPTSADNVPGAPLTNAADVAGNICLIQRGTYSFVSKAVNAQRAGAVAVIIENTSESNISMGGSPIPEPLTIPVVMITSSQGAAIRNTISLGTEVTVTLSSSINGADIIADYSSRGPRMDDSWLKPDLAAPAEFVHIALTDSATGRTTFNGTSSAAPHVAGLATLMRQKYPNWKVEEIKAALMNTAGNPVTLSLTDTTNIGVGRIGAGRVDAVDATNAKAVAYSLDNPGGVSVSFGVVDAYPGMAPQYKTVKVQNKSNKALTYNLSYQSSVTLFDGAAFSFPLGNQVRLRAGPDIKVVVVGLETDAAALTNWLDDSVSLEQTVTLTGLDVSLPIDRHWLPELAGYLVLTPTDPTEQTLRVPLHAAVRPVSQMSADFSAISMDQDGTYNVPLTGWGLEPTSYDNLPFEYLSLAKAFELQAVSANDDVDGDGSIDDSYGDGLDLRAVGITSDYNYNEGDLATTIMNIGIASWGNRSVTSPNVYNFQVAIDTNFDGNPDYFLLPLAMSTPAPDVANVYMSYLYELVERGKNPESKILNDDQTGYFILQDYLNGAGPGSLSTNLFNSSLITLPVYAADMGLTAGNSRFNYCVSSVWFGEEILDSTDWLTYDPATPGFDPVVSFFETNFWEDLPGNSIDVDYNMANFAANGSLGLAVFHFHNALDSRLEYTMVTPPAPLVALMSRTYGSEGDVITVIGKNFSGVTKVTFAPDRPASFKVISDTEMQITVPRRARTGSISLETAYGSYSTGRLKFKVTR